MEEWANIPAAVCANLAKNYRKRLTFVIVNILHYIYIYAFSRRFYPKRLTLHSSDSFYILSALAFPGNRTHDLGVASAMLYQLSYRKAKQRFLYQKLSYIFLLYQILISCNKMEINDLKNHAYNVIFWILFLDSVSHS